MDWSTTNFIWTIVPLSTKIRPINKFAILSMPLNTLMYSSASGQVRHIVVIKGQPYYRAYGGEDIESAYYKPFLMLKGNTSLINYSKVPAGYKKEDLIKEIFENNSVLPTAVISCNRDVFHDDMKDIPDEAFAYSEFPRRFARKQHLMTSFRLSLPFKIGLKEVYKKDLLEAEVLSTAGVTPREINWAIRNPILLPNNAPTMDDPDQVNQWLIRQGAFFLKKIISFPSSYREIWKMAKPISPQISSATVPDDKDDAAAKLKCAKEIIFDYTKNGSRLKRIFTFHWNRNFIAEIERVRARQSQFTTWQEMEEAINKEIKDIGTGSLAQRICFINKM